MKIKNIIIFFIVFSIYFLFPHGLYLKHRNSILKISSGAHLILNTKIHNVKGKVVKDIGAEIFGEDIEFDDGAFQESGNKTKISGNMTFGASNKIILDGGKLFEGKRGEVLTGINISGTGNKVAGVLFTLEELELEDQFTDVTLNLRNRLDSNINLNNGSIILDEDLFFLDGKRIIGPGTVTLNGHRICFGSKDFSWSEPILFKNASDISINSNIILDDCWTFSGDSILCGNGNILYLNSLNSIMIKSGTNLLIRDVILYGLSGNKISCIGDDSSITFQNVKLIQDGDYTFSVGSLTFFDNVEFIGKDKKFIYQTNMTSTIKDNAIVTLSNGFTFSYDPVSGNSNLLEFEADDSTIFLSGGNLYSSYNCLNLIKGRVVAEKESSIIIESREWIHETITGTEELEGITYTTYDYTYGTSGGINVGDGNILDDFKINILSGSTLNINNGILYYKNIDEDSFTFVNDSSVLRVNNGAYLNLEHTLDIIPGKIYLEKNSGLIKEAGVDLLGPMFILN